jgi:PAS domain S-box-containing protein
MDIERACDPKRLNALNQFQIMESESEIEFDNIVKLAAEYTECPIAYISFVDDKRSWFKAKIGIDFNEVNIEHSFCAQFAGADPYLVINDIDTRIEFINFPVRKEHPDLKFYAGVPIITVDGYMLGFLSVMDNKVREISDVQLKFLGLLRDQILGLLRLNLKAINIEKLRQESARKSVHLRNIFNYSIDGVLIFDSNFKIIEWNPVLEKIFKINSAEAVGKSLLELIFDVPQSKDFLNHVEGYMSGGFKHQGNVIFEQSGVDRDGNIKYLSIGVSSFLGQRGQYFPCFVSDKTEYITAQKEIANQKRFYETVMNNIPTDIVVFDKHHRYVFINPNGIKNNELREFAIGKDDFDYAKHTNRSAEPAMQRRKYFLEAIETKHQVGWEESAVGLDGQKYTKLRRFFPIVDENNEVDLVIGYGLDITDRKRLEEEQKSLLEKLSYQNLQLSDFCNIISHNLRAPLVSMTMLTEFIHTTDDQEEQKLLVSKLDPVLNSLNETFDELVNSLQVQQDTKIPVEDIDIHESIQRVLNGMDFDILHNNAKFEFDLESAPVISFPVKYMNSVLQNLISNAIKYRSLERDPLIKIKTQRIDNEVELIISDNGLGIDIERYKDQVFKIGKIFHRHPNAKGYGLFMTKTQIEAMGGSIGIESKLNEGTTFKITFIDQ